MSALLRSGDMAEAAAVADRVREHGVLVAPLAPAAIGTPRAGLILSYGPIPTERLPAGLAHLDAALRRSEIDT